MDKRVRTVFHLGAVSFLVSRYRVEWGIRKALYPGMWLVMLGWFRIGFRPRGLFTDAY